MRQGRILGLDRPEWRRQDIAVQSRCRACIRADTGTITLDGKPLDGLALHERARLGLARTWQHVRLFPSLSVIDNLIIGARDYPASGCDEMF